MYRCFLFNVGDKNISCQIYDSLYNLIGYGNSIKDNSVVIIELDLRSDKKEERIIHFVINNKEQEFFFYNVPFSVEIGVYYFLFSNFIFYLLIILSFSLFPYLHFCYFNYIYIDKYERKERFNRDIINV